MSVPVLGQPFGIINYTVCPTIKCNCERGGVVTLMAQRRDAGWVRTQEPCSACGKLFQIAAINIDQKGELQFGIEMAVPQHPALVAQ